MSRLWIPGIDKSKDVVEVKPMQVMNLPNEGKKEGGSYFDDELETAEEANAVMVAEIERLADHLNKRPDHTVYVGSAKDREQLRQVLNHWFKHKVINRHPNIRIDYGVPDGSIRVGE
jgi:hypothetical protein